MRQDAVSEALADLKVGNLRFCADRAEGPRRDAERRRAVAAKQSPKAAVLTCSDSRVVPELLFDQGLGDLFVVRTAGHVLDRGAVGSLEYALEHLQIPLVLILAHSRCGAVTAAVAGRPGPGSVDWVVNAIRPAVWATASAPGDAVENAAREHARRTSSDMVRMSALLHEAVERRRLSIVSAYYELVSGSVEFL
jgi:carbonic anhydrase